MSDGTQGGQAMEFPDGPGWWAGETANKRQFVIHWTEFDIRDDVLTVRWAEDSYSITYQVSSFKRDYMDAKWYRLYMPWEAPPSPVGASVPREVVKTMRLALRRERVFIETGDLDKGHEARELARIDAALAWLEQHAQSTQNGDN